MMLLVVGFVVVVFGVVLLLLWIALRPRKHVRKDADGSTWIDRDRRKLFDWLKDDEAKP